MPITRTFLDWDRPALPAVVDELIRTRSRNGQCDLSRCVIVFPGRRAGRRFLELLAEKTDGRHRPPQIVTIGELPELFYEPKRPFAPELVQKLAWAEAFRRLPEEQTSKVVRRVPDADDFDGWQALGELLWRQHTELAAEGRDFADVARAGQQVDGFDEQDRWEALATVQNTYLRMLDDLELWDRQTARLVAVQQKECTIDRDVLLVGTVDMNQTLRNMLDQVADRVTAYIHAPDSAAERFDEYGCLIPASWENAPIPLDMQQVRLVDTATDQAAEVIYSLSDFDGRYRPDEITVGITDERLVPQVQRVLTESEIPSRWVVARDMARTTPFRLLRAIADYIDGRRSDRFAALVRHPDVTAWLRRKGTGDYWLKQLDGYFALHLPRRLVSWLGEPEKSDALQKVAGLIDDLLKPLRGPDRPIGDWNETLTALLLAFYGDRKFNRDDAGDHVTLQACKQLQQALNAHAGLPESLAPKVGASQAIRMWLDQARRGTIPPLPDDSALELLGWLELPLDDTPALIVTTFNEGFVPTSVNSDLFLPNALRNQLGIMDNARRYARDAYALSALLHSREQTIFIAGRRDPQGEPLAPSRLMFAADSETVARRVQHFYEGGDNGGSRPPLAPQWPVTEPAAGLSIPRPDDSVELPETVRVTAFRDYIASPYRFYLRHVLKLRDVDDDVTEMSPLVFGNLLHEVLNRFGEDEVRRSTEPVRIRKYLHSQLEQTALSWFGNDRSAPVDIQLEQARARLSEFAEWQAAWAAEGWTITFTEAPEDNAAVVFETGDGRTLNLSGRIDRIDRHRDGRWMIFDYKTGESGDPPEKTHRRKKEEWIDLQLPLYRHLATLLGIEGEVGLGYIVLPRDTGNVRGLVAEWTNEELADADERAREIAAAILDREFWVELEASPGSLSEFDGICQSTSFDRDAVV
ncbi:ATP-dependent helicase/deoxyribonuclease subunit B [Maioricimonas rarisocia]|uniref:ATP-dependent helicase/deoxyribonuclease subunit B n=1 Tax=Maioricimonas rarisocia TaxID=2528026 RepID=A0A517Z8R4_9PLAN|nr:PD-(D/E)XK nuclease family protein [Maioricimonas rarisocia]QDU38878.1 ATP-dependent helicase/deoxyribonuclease subunit B [Maioricimonas rarisocia]